ncbi:glycoside hydrolase family 97 protein [Tenuifilum thalassicum]|uniref:Glycoside hydrolase family 97 protein n=1 Tax=Tenuifilum thalassicum TaxID=2590900 RepID=A0A7D3XD75_9BACT|nr:glycoside hydrolase family 97 protein [Tenuifilum thalassicum]QKG79552.1 glycoside hydrolase family 97 protein [Tenuifilum thalassicum]
MRLKLIRSAIVSLAFVFTSCQSNEYAVVSPSGTIKLTFTLSDGNRPTYSIKFDGSKVIKPSTLGFEFKNMPALGSDLKIDSVRTSSFSEVWEMPWGDQHWVDNTYNELKVYLSEIKSPNRKFALNFRVFNDGVGFRYEFPEQPSMDSVIILAENTKFNLNGDHTCWWQPGDWDIYEHLYRTTKLSQIDAVNSKSKNFLAQTYIPENAVNTPVTMKTSDGIYLCFHEADVCNYSGATLRVDTVNLSLETALVGNDSGVKVKTKAPFSTPWRTIIITRKPGDIVTSKLVLNLNEPNKIGDISWFKPMKYVGVWWEMHLGKSSWDMASGKHGATTANAKRYIDFAAKNGIKGLLVEGWNTGWEHWIGFEDREGIFDFVTPYPDYNLNEVVHYAKSKGVNLIMHHETSAAPRTYEQQLDTAFRLMQSLGIHSVKTGYVGKIIPKGEYHQGQWMVNHYRKVVETAAKYQIAVDAHEPFKGTGEWRTYPNVIARENFRGQEFNAWSTDGGNPPEHLTILPFTAQLAGPMDYTPGIFNIKLKPYKDENQVNSTLAYQLALYVVIYSPIQMVPDLPENYEGHPAFQFIRDVGVDWEQSLVLDAEIGDYIAIAREERNTGRWFVGAITDENPRDLTIKFDFLKPNVKYRATFYLDGPDAHWDKNPTSYKIENYEIDSTSEVDLKLAPGGGAAISIFPL